MTKCSKCDGRGFKVKSPGRVFFPVPTTRTKCRACKGTGFGATPPKPATFTHSFNEYGVPLMKPIALPSDRNDPVYRKKLEALVWKHTHRDFKGKWEDGTKTVLHRRLVGAVEALSSTPLSSLTVEELYRKLPAAVKDAIFEADVAGSVLPIRGGL